MTLAEKIQSLTDLELAEMWDRNSVLRHKSHLLFPVNRNLDKLYDLTTFNMFLTQRKEVLEALKLEIITRFKSRLKA